MVISKLGTTSEGKYSYVITRSVTTSGCALFASRKWESKSFRLRSGGPFSERSLIKVLARLWNGEVGSAKKSRIGFF